ncbi:hypothetical protein ACOSQ3_016430 [Xanthoceras sorbifolium]
MHVGPLNLNRPEYLKSDGPLVPPDKGKETMISSSTWPLDNSSHKAESINKVMLGALNVRKPKWKHSALEFKGNNSELGLTHPLDKRAAGITLEVSGDCKKARIPSFAYLFNRRFEVEACCRRCGHRQEFTLHAVWNCPKLNDVILGCSFIHGCSLHVSSYLSPSFEAVFSWIDLGVVIRDHIGKVLLLVVKCLDFLISPMIVEAIAITIALEKGFTSSIFETDASTVVKLIH